ncbi:1,4-alpha-glucan branching protein GlgB [Gorillibacterium sp. sgz5001074]|uniref:1,4-alpha-glucan branching protein GlgB n=1 Tax=Gorillibacterium sp. sgz5001074 TaxID=3446695 RepID=UPI003F66E1C4
MAVCNPTSHDLYLFHEGNLFHSYRTFGAHLETADGRAGVRFTVWAPHAVRVAVAGNFNGWDGSLHGMELLPESGGVWSLFIPELGEGDVYKYEITGADGRTRLKSDPYAFHSELRPHTASVVARLDQHQWGDAKWRRRTAKSPVFKQPVNVYEVHLGSWKYIENEVFYTYEEYARDLVEYVKEMGYTHIELLPLTEHPFDRSWGYQATGYYSATSRYGKPEQLMSFIDHCHQNGIGVLIDWVPGHFCKDDHGLRLFDGSPLYEHPDPNISEKTGWGTLAFDFSKPEVVSYLISNAVFWMDVYHVDGIRVDAVASMMSLCFDKSPDTAPRNMYGGFENLDALAFIKKMNKAVFQYFPNALMVAEDSSDYPLVTAPVHVGGLGFNYKWNMGWMNDVLKYMQKETVHRKHHHNLLTFSLMYAYSENYLLPFSHDEVVHGKKSLLNKMPGDYWQKFANLRLLYAYMMGHPGKKLLFMGGEFGQFDEWKDMEDLDWELLEYEKHQQMHGYVKQLNAVYAKEKALWEQDHHPNGFQWIDADNSGQSVLSFIRWSGSGEEHIVAVCNFTERVYHNYRIGVPAVGLYREILNTDLTPFGGSGQTNKARIQSMEEPLHGQPASISFTLPPLGAVWFKHKSNTRKGI